jgi:hypothetical protein
MFIALALVCFPFCSTHAQSQLASRIEVLTVRSLTYSGEVENVPDTFCAVTVGVSWTWVAILRTGQSGQEDDEAVSVGG